MAVTQLLDLHHSLCENVEYWRPSLLPRWPRMCIVSSPTTTTLSAVARSVWKAKVRCWPTSWRAVGRATGRLRPSSNRAARRSAAPAPSPVVACAPGWAPPPQWPPSPPSGPPAPAWPSPPPPPPAPPGTCPPLLWQWCDPRCLHQKRIMAVAEFIQKKRGKKVEAFFSPPLQSGWPKEAVVRPSGAPGMRLALERRVWGGLEPSESAATLESCLLFHTTGCNEQDTGCLSHVAL